jgi:hypothetical protein
MLLLCGCDALNPALLYQEAARKLDFSLDRVEPSLQLAFPLDQSRLTLGLDLGVNNASAQRLRTRKVSGNLMLNAQGSDHAIGLVGFPQGIDLAAQSRSTMRADLSFTYRDLKSVWEPLSGAVLHRQPATWKLGGTATFDVLGIEFGVPFNASKGTNR